MEKKEVVKMFSIFSVVYPKFIESGKEELMLEVWHSMLSRYPYELVKHAAETHIKSSRFAPTIHDLIQHITEYENIGKLDGMSAWGKVLKAIRDYGYYRETEALHSMPPEVAGVVKAMGWQTLCMSENDMADRSHFIKAYDAMQRRDKQIAMAGNLLHSMQEVQQLK